MEDEQPVRSLRADGVSLVGEHPGQPERFSRPFVLIDIDVAPARIHQHEPGQPRPDDEPDDEQPPVELGVHRREV